MPQIFLLYCIQQFNYSAYCQCMLLLFQGVCTEAGMYALRERRVHVTQEDFELAVAKVTQFAGVLCIPEIAVINFKKYQLSLPYLILPLKWTALRS